MEERIKELEALLRESLTVISYVQLATDYEDRKLTAAANKAWNKVHEFKAKVRQTLKHES